MGERTRGQALLELVGLVGVLQGQGVDEAVAADLELDLLGLAVALDPGSYNTSISVSIRNHYHTTGTTGTTEAQSH